MDDLSKVANVLLPDARFILSPIQDAYIRVEFIQAMVNTVEMTTL